MRVAVSDYDGTLFFNGRVRQEDICAVTAWRKAGNLFGLATGRDLSLALHGIRKWDIPFDFLVCMNGAALYDSNLKLIKSTDIPQNLIRRVLVHPAAQASLHYQLCTNGINKIYIRSEESYFRNLGFGFQEISYNEALFMNEVQQISLAYASEADYLQNAKRLKACFQDQLALNLNGYFIDINKSGVNKLAGLLDLLTIRDWPSEGLLAIGDGENDIAMIDHFRGYCVSNAPAEVVNASAGVYQNVGEMLLDLI
jgi:HAD superfamily hydrolase (TIGR01484 family)